MSRTRARSRRVSSARGHVKGGHRMGSGILGRHNVRPRSAPSGGFPMNETDQLPRQDRVKPTIVLVHGAFADASSWSDVIERLQQQGYTVIAAANPLRGV